MQRLAVGMKVFAINDERLGEVRLINSCCYEVQASSDMVCLTGDSIFNVADGRVTLICVAAQTARYSCPTHSRFAS